MADCIQSAASFVRDVAVLPGVGFTRANERQEMLFSEKLEDFAVAIRAHYPFERTAALRDGNRHMNEFDAEQRLGVCRVARCVLRTAVDCYTSEQALKALLDPTIIGPPHIAVIDHLLDLLPRHMHRLRTTISVDIFPRTYWPVLMHMVVFGAEHEQDDTYRLAW